MSRPRYVSGTSKSFNRCYGKIKRFIKGIVCLCFVFSFIVCILIAIKVLPVVSKWWEDSNHIAEQSRIEDFRTEETSYVYAADGTQLLKLRQGKDVEYVEYASLPEDVLSAFVAVEDKRFYQHHGVDWLSTAKAIMLLITNDGEITRGGSTITQQLARNVYLSFETSYERKAREIFLALALEKKYSKEQILEFYVNNINYSNGYYGIGAAAKGYFDKSVAELSVEEVAFLCAIPNNPTFYNPRENFKNTISRRNVILKEMFDQGYLEEEAYLKACNSPVKLVEKEDEYCDYAASYALECAIRVFMQKSGFEFRFSWDDNNDYGQYCLKYKTAYENAKQLLYSGGYRVYTTMDLDLQNQLQQVMDEQLADLTEVGANGEFLAQGAATVVNNEKGCVVATIGGRSSENGGYLKLNRAFQSYKQPGSTIKPLVVYAPALENGYTPDSIVLDFPIEDGPKNADDSYWGEITLRTAVEQSKNVVAWRLFQELTPRRGLKYVQQMNFSKIVPDDYYLPASLGGLTYGVTTEEMAGGYAALANQGNWKEPTCIEKVLDNKGSIVWDGAKAISVYSKETAMDMTDVLCGVSMNGTAKGITLKGGHEFACKTGTTNANKVGWFCGYTHYYSIAVYVGADNGNNAISNLWGGTYPAKVWAAMQNVLLEGKEPVDLVVKSADEPASEDDSESFNEQEPDWNSDPTFSEPEEEHKDESIGDSQPEEEDSSVSSESILNEEQFDKTPSETTSESEPSDDATPESDLQLPTEEEQLPSVENETKIPEKTENPESNVPIEEQKPDNSTTVEIETDSGNVVDTTVPVM